MAQKVILAKMAAVTLVLGLLLVPFSLYAAGRVIVGVRERGTHYNWHFYVMQKKKFLRGSGLEVKFVPFKRSSVQKDALKNGTIHFLVKAETHAILKRQLLDKEPVVIVGGVLNKLPYEFVVRKQIEDIRQLKGQKLGIRSYTSSLTFVLKRYLAARGLRYPKDYKLTRVGASSRRLRALRTKKISGGLIGSARLLSIDVERQGLKSFGNLNEEFPRYQFAVSVANRDWAVKNGKELRALLRSLKLAITWLQRPKNKREALRILSDKMPKLKKTRASRLYDDWYGENPMFSKDGAVDPEGLKATLEAISRSNPKMRSLAKTYFDSKDYVDTTLLK